VEARLRRGIGFFLDAGVFVSDLWWVAGAVIIEYRLLTIV
jgi:hypothetical protein